MKRIHSLLSRANPSGFGLLGFFSFFPSVAGTAYGGWSHWVNQCPPPPPGPHPAHQSPWLPGLCPIMMLTKSSALLRMEPGCPARKFRGNLDAFCSCLYYLASHWHLLQTSHPQPLVSAFLWSSWWGNLCFFLTPLPSKSPAHLLHFWDHSFHWRSLGHLSPSSRFSRF